MSFFSLLSVPNLLTLSNLIFGLTGIICVTHGRNDYALYCALGAILADFLDGFIARRINRESPIGKELDSLSDLVTFGCLPGIMIFEHLNHSGLSFWHCLPAFILPAFSALRLARFNLEKNTSSYFQGVPTPITGLCWLSWFYPPVNPMMEQPTVIFINLGITSLLLICELPMLSFKLKKIFSPENYLLFLFVVLSFVQIIFFRWKAGPAIYLTYVLCGIGLSIKSRYQKKQ